MTDSKKKTTAAKTKTATASAKKTTTVKKAVAAALPVTAQSDLPTADALKERFKAGSIPLQTDFADLIDLADMGRYAAPKGLISMFSGSEIPTGWALCDGENGTPDLRDRFIVGQGSTFTGQGDGTTTTEEVVSEGSIDVEETVLDISQIPLHSHALRYDQIYIDSRGVSYRINTPTGNYSDAVTEGTGDGKGHSHKATLKMNAHTHSISPIPPYYALAFIMKL